MDKSKIDCAESSVRKSIWGYCLCFLQFYVPLLDQLLLDITIVFAVSSINNTSMGVRLLCSLEKTHLHPTKHLLSPLASALFSSFCKNEHLKKFSLPPLSPPVAKKLPFTATAHGVMWQDPYRWMSENINDPDFTSYLNQENSYAESFMRDTEKTQRTLYSEMVSRMPSNISTPPERWGPWYEFSFYILCACLCCVNNQVLVSLIISH